MSDRRHNFLPASLCLPLGIVAAITLGYAAWHLAATVPDAADPLLFRLVVERFPETEPAFVADHLPATVAALSRASLVLAGVMLLASFAGLLRLRPALRLLRLGYGVLYLQALLYAYFVLAYIGTLRRHQLQLDGPALGDVEVVALWWQWLWPALLLVLLTALLHLVSHRRATLNLYSGQHETAPALGDRILENIRTSGRDPRYRRSIWASLAIHFILIIGPLLIPFYGCVDPYRVPQGSGQPVVLQVQVVKKKKQKKRYILNPDSPIIFRVPDLDQSQVLKDIDVQSQLTYKADPNALAGRMGAGGGTKGGWPDGMKDGKVRLVRLNHGGPDWDDGMDAKTAADRNFLAEFKRLTGFKTAENGEAHPIRLLKSYPKGYAPPFVYMTGTGRIDYNSADLKALREYLVDGGLLLGDASSPAFHKAFLSFAKALFPDKELLTIADDDPLFQMPYGFPNGAPPLWHHGGSRALGIKHNNRWVVFYHPGDLNDAWKDPRYSDLDPQLRNGAFQMGVNVVYYAFTHYLEMTRKYRK